MSEWTKKQREVCPLPQTIEFSGISDYDDWGEVKYEIEKARLYLDYLEDSLKPTSNSIMGKGVGIDEFVENSESPNLRNSEFYD
jgi:hypothetical protein